MWAQSVKNIKLEDAHEAATVVEHYISRWSRCEDPIRFLKQTFKIEKFLIDQMPAIRAWFFFISVAFSVLFEIECWEKILGWIVKLSQPFGKDVQFNYYRILRGLKEFFYLLLLSPLHLPRSP